MSKIQTLSFWFLCGLLWQILSSLTVKTFGFEYPLYVSLILREMDWLVIRRQIWSTPVHLVQVTIILLSLNMPNLGSDYSSYRKCKIIKYAAENQFNLNIEFIRGVYKIFMKETHNQISNTQKHAVYPNGSVTYYHSFLTVTTNLNPVEYHPHTDILKHVDRGLLHAWQALESVQWYGPLEINISVFVSSHQWVQLIIWAIIKPGGFLLMFHREDNLRPGTLFPPLLHCVYT